MTELDSPRSICVFCGSRTGERAAYVEKANEVGLALAQSNITLIYGGGSTGLMGAIADAVLAAQGRVVGVIPEKLVSRELAHNRLDELHVVPDMHARKALMARLSGAFIAMPGGIGTMEELFEALTWQQLGYQDKPVGLLNVAGYFDSLVEFLHTTVDQGFLDAPTLQRMLTATDGSTLVSRLAQIAFAD